jgi:hypothetical protein
MEGVGYKVNAVAVEAVISGEFGVRGPGAKVVEGQLGNGEEEVPKVGGHGWVNG